MFVILLLYILTLKSAVCIQLWQQRALQNVIREIERNEFKELCDLFFLDHPGKFLSSEILENAENPQVVITESRTTPSQGLLDKLHSKCVFVIREQHKNGSLSLSSKIVSPVRYAMIINIREDVNVVSSSEEELNNFPRNMIELTINKNKNVISQDLICTQNLGHVRLSKVNYWLQRKEEQQTSPVVPMSGTMPIKLCPHPLNGKTLRATFVFNFPNIYKDDSAEEGINGFEVMILRALMRRYNFTVRFMETEFGYFDRKARKWTGRYGMLVRNEADMALMSGTAQDPLQKITDFTTTFSHVDLRWWTRKPIPLPKYDQFIIVFSLPVWFAALSTYFVLSASFATVYKVYKSERFEGSGLAGILRNPADFVILTFASRMEPGGVPWFPKDSAGRYITLLWSLCNVFITFFYLSNLRSDLLRQDYEAPVDTTAQVVRLDSTIYMHSWVFNFYRNVKIGNPDLAEAISLIESRHGTWTSPASIGNISADIFAHRAVLAEPTVGLRSLSWHLHVRGIEEERLHGSTESVGDLYVIFHLRKGTAWIHDFDRSIGQMFDMGLVDHFMDSVLPTKTEAKRTTEEASPIVMAQMVSALFLLAIGYGLGIIAFVFEIMARMLT